MFSQDELQQYERDGFVYVRGLLDAEELHALRQAIQDDSQIIAHSFELNDGHGLKSKTSSTLRQGSTDVTGLIARADKVVNRMEQVLGGEVYHYHTKLMMKEAHTGGSFVWHQDYGYWYQNGWLYPDLATVFIAIDPSTKVNGCLQVLRGSHRMGRIEHTRVGGQTGADTARVNEAMKVQELVYVELQPGDAVYFHCNLLHKSDQNHSDIPRYAFLVSYNKADNVSNKPHHHPMYTKLEKVRDIEIKNCKTKEMDGKAFMDPSTDETIKAQDYH